MCLLSGKELYTCQSALEDFQGILNVVGGPEERKRAEELLSRVTVVPDSTDPQTETMGTSGKIKTRAKVVHVGSLYSSAFCRRVSTNQKGSPQKLMIFYYFSKMCLGNSSPIFSGAIKVYLPRLMHKKLVSKISLSYSDDLIIFLE